MALVIPPAGYDNLGNFDERRAYETPAAPVIRADKIDPETQEFDSFTKDIDPIDAQVIESLWRVRASGAAVRETGTRFLDISKLDDSAPRAFEYEARNGLKTLIENNDISNLVFSVETDRTDTSAQLNVSYTNNRAVTPNKRRNITINLHESVINGQSR